MARTVQEEIDLERKHFQMGVEEFRTKAKEKQNKGQDTANRYGVELLHEAVRDMIPAVEAWVRSALSRPGRKNVAVLPLANVDLDVASLVTARNAIDGITMDRPLTGVALRIGGEIEDEVKLGTFRDTKEPIFDAVQGNLKKHPMGNNPVVRRSMFRHAADKFAVEHKAWPKSTKILVGSRLLELFAESTNLIVIYRALNRGQRANRIAPSPILMEWIEESIERGALLKPRYLPTIVPPKPWTGLTGGGYYIRELRSKLISTPLKGYGQELAYAEMPKVYETINALQSTAYRINKPVLEVALKMRHANVSFPGWPPATTQTPGPKPDYETNPEAWRHWKGEAGQLMRKKITEDSLRIQVGAVLDIAKEYADEASIYFPHHLDFRGRMYPKPALLQPQGSDLAKGLLTFAGAKPLGEDGVGWLAIHVANNYGIDKVSFEDRIKWTLDNEARIIATAADPLSDLWWTEADKGEKAWEFLAACIEWAAMRAHPDGPESYPSSLPVVVDGTCNGIQLFSLAMRDEVAGAKVNCVPSEKPSDIYQAVADRLIERLKANPPASEPLWPEMWMKYGISRKLVKRPVMVLPYSGTRNAFRKYIIDYVLSSADAGTPHPFGKAIGRASAWLADLLWESAKEVVVGPRLAMDWLQECVQMVYKNGDKTVPLTWTAPSGFVVMQAYAVRVIKRIESANGSARVQLNMSDTTNTLDPRRQRQAVAPNFIHSLDASLLCSTVNACRAQGLTSFLSVHDCYGTFAADMTTLSDAVRDEAVKMFTPDVLEAWRQELQPLCSKPLPRPPEKGSLDLEGLRQASFFFA